MSKQTNFIRVCEDSERFEPVNEPQLNYYYHLNWAYKGARFCLTKINEDGTGQVWTGKTKNKFIDIKLSDLRHLRDKYIKT